MNDENEQADLVIAFFDQINRILAGNDIAYVHTALNLAVACHIIAAATDSDGRQKIITTHVEQVRQLMQPEWVDYIRACIKRVSSPPQRRQYAMIIDLNRANLSDKPINQLINKLIERAERPSENYRKYLGASAIGSDCLRKVQFDWMCDPVFPARIKDIFARGHFFEDITRQHLIAAGFKFAPPDRLEFQAVGGLFRGHADGVLIAGPELPALRYPALWEHKCVGAKGFHAIERGGLVGLYAVYAAQVATYQAYLDVTNAALFSVVNADTAERLHFLVPFDAQLAQAISDRAVTVIEATRVGELLSRVTEDPEDWRCKMCSHRERCWRC